MKKYLLIAALLVLTSGAASECKQDGPGKEDRKPDPKGTWVVPSPSPTPPCLMSKGGCVSVPPKK